MRTSHIRGGCFCGAVSFTLTPPSDFCSHCHCHSCRRVSGAAFLTWTSVPEDRFALVDSDSALVWYKSSDAIRWGFCGTCGTTMLYAADRPGHPEQPGLDRMYVTVGSLSDPLDRAPACHVSFEEHVAWFESGDHLPKRRGKSDVLEPAPRAHIILYVADQKLSSAFYTAVLQQAPRLDVPGMTEFALSGGTVLGLMPNAGAERLLGVSTSGESRAELYLRVHDPAEAHQRAIEAGAVELSPPEARDWGHLAAYSRDLDGHVLAFASA